MNKIFYILLAAALVSSCGIYTPYKRPEVKTDGLFRDTTSATDTASLGNRPWKELFTDPALQELIEQGLPFGY